MSFKVETCPNDFLLCKYTYLEQIETSASMEEGNPSGSRLPISYRMILPTVRGYWEADRFWSEENGERPIQDDPWDADIIFLEELTGANHYRI